MKHTVSMILSVLLALMSLLLMIAQPVVGLIGLAFAVFIFFWSKKAKKTEKAEKEAREAESAKRQAEFNERLKAVNEMKIPSGKYSKTMTVKLTGVTFDCVKNYLSRRQDVLEDMEDGDPVLIEPYPFDGRNGYLCVNPLDGMDVGMLPDEVAQEYPNAKIEGYLTGLNSFVPRDGRERIYFSKVKIYIMEDA